MTCSNLADGQPKCSTRYSYDDIYISRWNGGSMYGGEYIVVRGSSGNNARLASYDVNSCAETWSWDYNESGDGSTGQWAMIGLEALGTRVCGAGTGERSATGFDQWLFCADTATGQLTHNRTYRGPFGLDQVSFIEYKAFDVYWGGSSQWSSSRYDAVFHKLSLQPSSGSDSDGDGILDPNDNCPAVSNPGQENDDGDEFGNLCDACPFDPQNDADGDGVCADFDPCPLDPLDDADGDGFCSDADTCPADYNPEQTDTDSDGIGDTCDVCDADPLNDLDGDGICGDVDGCPDFADPDQTDTDSDGIGDVCDACPFDPNNDADGDGICGSKPVVDAGPDLSASEGTLLSFSFSFEDANDTGNHTVAVDFGDGSPTSNSLTPQHTYADNGTYTVIVTVTDDQGGAGTDQMNVEVLNLAPEVDPVANRTLEPGEPVLVTATFRDQGYDYPPAGTSENFTATIEWGDGAASTGTVAETSGSEGIPTTGTVQASHTYNNEGTYVPVLCVADDDGGQSCREFTVEVNLPNQPPVVDAGPDLSASEGTLLSFSFSFEDANDTGNHTVAVDFGDGSPTSNSLTPQHTYADNGTYTVIVTVTDDQGGAGTDQMNVVVFNSPPEVDPIANRTLEPGEPAFVTATFRDRGYDYPAAGTSEDFTATIEWGDGAAFTGTVAETSGSEGVPTTGTVQASHTYNNEGTYSGQLCVTDDDGGQDCRLLTITVTADTENNPPIANAGLDQTIECTDISTAFTLDGSASFDPYGDSLTFAWTGDFGTASGLNPTVNLPLGTSTVQLVVNDGEVDSAPDSVDITVDTQVTGLFPPMAGLVPEGQIPPLPQKAFKTGNTLPLRLQLSCETNSPPEIVGIQRVGKTNELEVIDLDSGNSNDSGTLFRYDPTNGQWIFNLGTMGWQTGEYFIVIDVGGKRYVARFVIS